MTTVRAVGSQPTAIEQPTTTFELVVNVDTAKALRPTIQQSVWGRPDRFIE